MLSCDAMVTAQSCATAVRLPSTLKSLRPCERRSWLISATNCDDSPGTGEICSSGAAAAQPVAKGDATAQTEASAATTSVVENVVMSFLAFTESQSARRFLG
jgi:hypothetical protein